MTMKQKIIAIIVVILIIVIGLAFAARTPSYNSVIYLTTGEIYVGKISKFPKISLSDGFLIQTSAQGIGEGPSIQLFPLSETVWGPEKIFINEDQVIFFGRLNEESNIAKTIRAEEERLKASEE